MLDFATLLAGVRARLSAAGDDVERRAKILRALADAEAELEYDDVRARDYWYGVKGAAYQNVYSALWLVQNPGGNPSYVSNEDGNPAYEAEVQRLWQIIERVLAEKLD